MFICRFRLVTRSKPSPSPLLRSHVIITQRFSSRETTPSRQCPAVPISLHPPSASSTHVFERDTLPTDNIRISASSHPGLPTQNTTERCPTTSNQDQEEAKKEADANHSPTLHKLYARLLTPEYAKLPTQLSSEQVRSIAFRARDSRHASVLDNLSRNILDSPEGVRFELAASLLSIPHLPLNPFLRTSLLHCINPDHLSSLSLYTLSRIACTLIPHSSSSTAEKLLTRLAEDIALRLKPLSKNNHGPSSSDRHAVLIRSLFRLVVHLSELHLRDAAMSILQSLIEAAYIPPEAIQRTDQSSRDFHLIIILTLVRSCIFWKWNYRALAILRGYLGRKSSVCPAINRLCQDVLYALVEFPTVKDLHLGVSFVKDLVSSPEPILIPSGVVRQIYDSAQRLGQPQIATRLYTLSQGELTQSLHTLPLPSGTALTWFLRYLSNRASYLHLARSLVGQVVDGYEPIPLADRAAFITIAAECGFANPARSLWERYSSGTGVRMVAGNAAMVVRMCSLFAGLRRGRASQISEELATASLVDGGPHGETRLSHTIEEEKDFRSFAYLVLARYREAKEPLRQASREDLNALARANIILGQVTEALQVLRVVIDRNESPDLHDVNVVLSAVASVDPNMALKTVRRMVALGPKPDGISFGTVIHHAARQGDFAVIIGALRLAQKTGQQLTTKTMVAIIRASVALSGADKDAVRDNLVRALEVIMANEHSNQLATFDMGQFCADEALGANDPALAFAFWERVLQPIAEWDDGEHVSLRRRIANSVRSQGEKGHIRAEDVGKMTSALQGRGPGEEVEGGRG